eukprot:TRINITY_DN29405_c0_g1_i1.p1 TRINITY_DN29405_c0_g1~~TRINITY_DN29405_c0_g1_i1.p1  ORF type:complete len:2528 (-),score=343.66 TRINITY_DN29405_c0_g1_i1:202-7785(-)
MARGVCQYFCSLVTFGLILVEPAFAAQDSQQAFLSAENPLRVLSVLPAPIGSAESARLHGRTAITVVFSRAIIALGSDWSGAGNNGTLAKELEAFTLQACTGQPQFAVKGRLRWATTSIARFDAEYDWPSDLCFDLVLNPHLKTFDGLSVTQTTGASSWRFTTDSVAMYASFVRSIKATNLTGGRWSSVITGSDQHECPPDAIVYLTFSSDLHHATAFATLQNANRNLLPSPESDKYESCGKKCLAFQPRGLLSGSAHNLIFSKGGMFSLVGGKAGVEQTVKLAGLQPFKFSFIDTKYQKLQYRRYNLYLRHGLAHGVSTEGQLAALQAAIVLRSVEGMSLPLSLSLVDQATLQIYSAALEPSQRYSLQVSASSEVLDGYDQPLQASTVEYQTQGWPENNLQASESPAYFRALRRGWTLLSRGFASTAGSSVFVRSWPITAQNFVAALAQRFNNNGYDSGGNFLGSTNLNEVKATSINPLQVVSVTNGNLGNLFLRETQEVRSNQYSHYQRGIVSLANFGICMVATPTNELIVWASHFDSGLGVDGATVKVYRTQYYSAKPENVVLVATGITGSDGLATLAPHAGMDWHGSNSYSEQLVALAETRDFQMAYSESVPTPWNANSGPTQRAVLVTDRSIYRPGDAVFVKGYLRSIASSGDAYSLLTGGGGSFAIDVRWKASQSGKESMHRTVVPLIQQYGTVSANLSVPKSEDDVTFGDISLHLVQVPISGNAATLATTSIIVADPRPPTVTLSLSTSDSVVLPGQAASLRLSLRAASYTGLAVEGANVTLTWRLERAKKVSSSGGNIDEVVGMQSLPSTKTGTSSVDSQIGAWRPMVSQEPDPTGQVAITIGQDGSTNLTLALAELLQTAGENDQGVLPCEEGDTLFVSARWVGPTREVVTAELEGGTVRIARSPYTLAVLPARSVDSTVGLPLPGTPFPIYAYVRDHAGGNVDSITVSMSLHEWDGSSPVRENPMASLGSADPAQLRLAATKTGLLPADSWGSQVGPACSIVTGASAQAQCGTELSLPAAKKYVVLAQAVGPDGIELVTAFVVGKSATEWKNAPLAGLDVALTARFDKSTYSVGDEAALSFLSPFKDATALVVWGNGLGRKSRLQSLNGTAGQQHTVQLQVGKECSFGCDILIFLAAPSQPVEAVMPVQVPISPLLDLTLPRTATTSIKLNVPDTGRAFEEGTIQLAVISQQDSNSHVEVLQPGSKAFVRIAAPAGSEACLFMVDKAFLDIGGAANPHKAERLDERFKLQQGEPLRVADTRDRLASEGGYNHTIEVSMRRASIDPWAYDYSWALLPDRFRSKQPAEQPDSEYFVSKADDITGFPYQATWYGGPQIGFPSRGGGFVDDMGSPVYASPPGLAESAAGGVVADDSQDTNKVGAPSPSPPPPAGGAASGGSTAYVRSNFLATPLFVASRTIDANGIAVVPFVLPDNIGTFEIRVYIVGPNATHKFGHATKSIVSRRDVSMISSMPRVVRPGDRFDCGVLVSRHGITAGIDLLSKLVNSSSVVLRESDLALYGATKHVPGMDWHTHGVKLLVGSELGDGPNEIVFPFEVLPSNQSSVGMTTFGFSATLPDQSNLLVDAMEASLQVKPMQSPVVVSTSVAISASSGGEAKPWSEGIVLPNAMSGSGHLLLTAGVGYLPAVSVYALDVCNRHMQSGLALAAALLPSAALAYYYTPGTSQSVDVIQAANLDRAAQAFQHSANSLMSYTDNNYGRPLGLMWSKGDQSLSWRRASISLNAFALISARLVSLSAASTSSKVAAPPLDDGTWSTLRLDVSQDLTSAWRRALDSELQRRVEELYSRTPRCTSSCFQSWGTLAEARAAMGFDWVPQTARAQSELSMERLFSSQALESLGADGLAHAALAYTLHSTGTLPGEASGRLDGVYRRLASSMRVQGATAYVSRSLASSHSAGLGANALVLLALAHAGDAARAKYFGGDSGSTLVAKLASYVARGGHASTGGYWIGNREAAYATLALSAYDHAMGSNRPDLMLTATSGQHSLLSYEARTAGAPPGKSSTPWEALPPKPAPVEFLASGEGQVSVSASLTFVPASAPMEGAVYRGIFVEKVVQKMDPATGEATGPPLQIIKLGESVVVTIQVTTPDDLSRVVLEDATAGGLEPVDPNVADDTAGSDASGGCDSSWWSWWCIPRFYFRETYSDRVVWKSWETLPAGTHTVSYQAVAATRGVFTLPPTQAYVDDQPEVMGLSQAGTVVIAGMKSGVKAVGADDEMEAGLLASSVPQPEMKEDVVRFLRRLRVKPNSIAAPKGCDGGCSAGQACQLSTGLCLCYSTSQSSLVLCNETDEVEARPTPSPTPTPSVSGSFSVTMSDPSVILNNIALTAFQDALKVELAAVAGNGITASMVNISLRAASENRRLQTEGLVVDYSIALPAAVAASASMVVTSVKAQSTTQLRDRVNVALTAAAQTVPALSNTQVTDLRILKEATANIPQLSSSTTAFASTTVNGATVSATTSITPAVTQSSADAALPLASAAILQKHLLFSFGVYLIVCAVQPYNS